MTEQIPDPPEFVLPPDEVVRAIADQMRGSQADLTDEQKEWFADYRKRQALADADARERRRQLEVAQRAEADRQAREVAQRAAEEQKAALRARVRAMSDKLSATSPDNRLEAIHAHALAADARRIAAEKEFARRQWQANVNATIDDILRTVNPPPTPIPVRIIYDD